MNKSKCKKCKKWHAREVDLSSPFGYALFSGCKCNDEIYKAVIQYGVPFRMRKGTVVLSKKDHEMLTFVLEEE